MAREMTETREEIWREELSKLLRRRRRGGTELATSRKSAEWKVALAAELKARTTATNRWLAEALHMGGLYQVSRLVSAWQKRARK